MHAAVLQFVNKSSANDSVTSIPRFITLYVLAFVAMAFSVAGNAAEPWQKWRVDASNHPQRWLNTTQEWIQTYDRERQFKDLALAYAIRVEALRYSGDEDHVQAAIEEGLRFAKLADYPTATSLLRINQGWYFIQRGMLKRAASSAIYAIEAAKDADNSNLIIEAEILQAQVFHESGDVARALEILEALEQKRYSDLPRLQMEFHGLIGAIYLEIGAYNIALQHMHDTLSIAEQHLGDWDVSVAQYNLGRAYSLTSDYQKARQYFNQALASSRKIDDQLGIAYALQRLAEIEDTQGNEQRALQLIERALPVFKAAGAHPMEAQAWLAKSEIHLEQQQIISAEQTLQAAQSLINTLNDTKLLQRLYELRSRLFQQQQDYQQALAAYQQSVDYLLQHQQTLQNKQIQEIMVRLEIREQEATNELLQKENQLQQLQLQEQRTSNYLMLWLLFSGAAIVLLISYFLYQQMRARRRYAELALKDDLTGAPNRRAIVRQCQLGLEAVAHGQHQLALAVVDFDFFKQINDSFGHDVGDAVLQRFAEVTQDCLRSQDKFGRLGGEEWLLVLYDATEQDAELIFNRLLNRINEHAIRGLPESYRITFSMGFATATASDTFETLYKRADDVLYDAKEHGRQRLKIAPAAAVASD